MPKLKTSISLPAHAKSEWQTHRNAIETQLSAYLRAFHKSAPRRDGLLQFNDCQAGLVRFNVYWSQDTYDQLHSVAHALRISVSHLLWLILKFVLSGARLEPAFSNYEMKIVEWSKTCFTYAKTLRFSPQIEPPDGTDNKDNTPYRFTR